MESGRVSATHVLVEKRYGIRERPAASHVNLQSRRSRNAFYMRKHKKSGGSVQRAFSLKKQGVSRGWSSVAHKFRVKMKPRRILYGIHNDFSGGGGGLRRGCILIRNRDWWRSLHLHTCDMRQNSWGGVGWGCGVAVGPGQCNVHMFFHSLRLGAKAKQSHELRLRFPKYCACHKKGPSNFTKYCTYHKKKGLVTQPNIAPATKNDTTTLPSIAPAAKSDTTISRFTSIAPATRNEITTWQNIAPAMESDATTSPNIAPATIKAF